jgi:hypothetical protein
MGLFDKLKDLSGPKSPDPEEQCTNAELQAHGALSVMERLKALGDKKQVNPPPPAASVPEPIAPVPEAVSEEGTACPTCGKVFRHLSRHKCKGPQSLNEEEQPANADVPEHAPGRSLSVSVGFILILDALFEKNTNGVPLLFTDIIGPLADAVAKENNVGHWGAVDYAKGGPLLAVKLGKWLEATKPQGIILADSSTPELRAVKEVLKRAARAVIQGVR